jgi:uncharacterized protein YdeI (YjbR/CyaY-like superfamily)
VEQSELIQTVLRSGNPMARRIAFSELTPRNRLKVLLMYRTSKIKQKAKKAKRVKRAAHDARATTRSQS